MTYTFAEALHVGDAVYQFDSYPLQPYAATRPAWPRFPKRPWNTNGYFATWAVREETLYLTALQAPGDDPMALLFPDRRGPVPAFWVDEVLHAVRGRQRHVGYPPRRIADDELVLDVRAGKVVRMWRLDLRTVPDQTDDERRLSLPRFLWPRRLLDGEGGAGR